MYPYRRVSCRRHRFAIVTRHQLPRERRMRRYAISESFLRLRHVRIGVFVLSQSRLDYLTKGPPILSCLTSTLKRILFQCMFTKHLRLPNHFHRCAFSEKSCRQLMFSTLIKAFIIPFPHSQMRAPLLVHAKTYFATT
jgi:hypothetical protein